LAIERPVRALIFELVILPIEIGCRIFYILVKPGQSEHQLTALYLFAETGQAGDPTIRAGIDLAAVAALAVGFDQFMPPL
jgi:hypothetical protein